ncbi:Putative NADP-dependent oxidoreductase YfmJ [Variovorax sp. PBS-H4]|uniref:NADP-dependent oxidoreductase n=1 Tax=Variovorax sp. PBS-H4 TaxID=434008 RepID=UPI00131828AB|nr:NADP-dependent oxidoreductase [Variovorax sp. PBS-H4]VTU28124.1 Putative NADP-dependent oxidoreductase YfmJ [Variovorax sp. PBS-H4]
MKQQLNRKITLKSRPSGMPRVEDFELRQEPVPAPGPGQVLLQTLFLSLDPYMRGRISDAKNYAAPVGLGEVIVGGTVSRVLESAAPGFNKGDIVEGPGGWQELSVLAAGSLRKVDPDLAPPSTALGVLGMPGLTAYFSILHVARPISGDVVVISGAAGAVGQLAGQIAKLAGCIVIGIAGSDDKLEYCQKTLGFDHVINYKKTPELASVLTKLCPAGVNVYLDGVGGAISQAVFGNLAFKARVVIIGQISQSNLVEPDLGPRSMRYLLTSRARIEGFLVGDWQSRNSEALLRLSGWLKAGQIQYSEHQVDGLENAPSAFIGMLSGANLGKTIVRVAD